MVKAVTRSLAGPFLRRRSTVEPPPVLFQEMTNSPPAVRVALPRGAEKALTAAMAPVMAVERVTKTVANFIVKGKVNRHGKNGNKRANEFPSECVE